MNQPNHTDIYVEFLRRHLQNNYDAILWVLAYGILCHSIDDIVDGDISKDLNKSQFMLQQFEFTEVVYTNQFYLDNIFKLRPLVKAASQAYMDSVILEQSSNPIHKRMADPLRQLGHEVILACVEIVGGVNARRAASIELREIGWKTHHDELGNPV